MEVNIETIPSLIYSARAPVYIGTHRHQIYNQRDAPESMYRVADVYALSHEWILLQSLQNITDMPQTFTHTLRTGVDVIKGNKTVDSMSLEKIFSDPGITTGHSTINTAPDNAASEDIPVQIGANTSAFLYRKRIKYRVDVHFQLDANDWREFRTVGAWRQGPTPLLGVYEIYVNTRDCVIVSKPLSGASFLDDPRVGGPPARPSVQPWDRCTGKCTGWLHSNNF
ncbi:uncharacterized protein EI90DRAFT_3021458 [Cantharellus anzutake]|nr:uncharacterized protein EI90DRAFT_3021458 [Cantharellus anzutake]KAF8316967.1 hypothetical protein EI90DRAFT_3021458 [Cantharellus anzutake]